MGAWFSASVQPFPFRYAGNEGHEWEFRRQGRTCLTASGWIALSGREAALMYRHRIRELDLIYAERIGYGA